MSIFFAFRIRSRYVGFHKIILRRNILLQHMAIGDSAQSIFLTTLLSHFALLPALAQLIHRRWIVRGVRRLLLSSDFHYVPLLPDVQHPSLPHRAAVASARQHRCPLLLLMPLRLSLQFSVGCGRSRTQVRPLFCGYGFPRGGPLERCLHVWAYRMLRSGAGGVLRDREEKDALLRMEELRGWVRRVACRHVFFSCWAWTMRTTRGDCTMASGTSVLA